MTGQYGEKGSAKLVIIIILAASLLGLTGFITYQNSTKQDVTAIASTAASSQTSSTAPLSDTVYALNDQYHVALLNGTLEDAEMNAGCTSISTDNSFDFVYRDFVGTLGDLADYSIVSPIISQYDSLAETQLESACFGTPEMTDPQSLTDFYANIQATVSSALIRFTAL